MHAHIVGFAASDDTITIRVQNERFPRGAYILGSDTTGVGR